MEQQQTYAENNSDLEFTTWPARYSKGMISVRPKPDGSGWKTLAAMIISNMPGVRWSGREGAYIVTPSRARKFAEEIEAVKVRRATLETPCSD